MKSLHHSKLAAIQYSSFSHNILIVSLLSVISSEITASLFLLSVFVNEGLTFMFSVYCHMFLKFGNCPYSFHSLTQKCHLFLIRPLCYVMCYDPHPATLVDIFVRDIILPIPTFHLLPSVFLPFLNYSDLQLVVCTHVITHYTLKNDLPLI